MVCMYTKLAFVCCLFSAVITIIFIMKMFYCMSTPSMLHGVVSIELSWFYGIALWWDRKVCLWFLNSTVAKPCFALYLYCTCHSCIYICTSMFSAYIYGDALKKRHIQCNVVCINEYCISLYWLQSCWKKSFSYSLHWMKIYCMQISWQYLFRHFRCCIKSVHYNYFV